MLILIAGNLIALTICWFLRKTKAVVIPIVALGLYGALVASTQSLSLTRSTAPPRRLTEVTKEYSEGYFAAVQLARRYEWPLGALYLNLVLMSLIGITARQPRDKVKESGRG